MIRLYTRSRVLEKTLKDACAGHPVGGIHVETPQYRDRPRAAQYVITKSRLTTQLEYFAARLGAYVLVLPEAMPWLLERIMREHSTGVETKIIGSDYANPNRNGE